MTRTRTHTALAKLARAIAEVHGELAFIDSGSLRLSCPREHANLLDNRRRQLQSDLDALRLTLKQFDPDLEPDSIGAANGWMRRFGRARTPRAVVRRYLEWLAG
jgi:hypothetical protein